VLLKRDASAVAGVVPKVADFGLSVLLPEQASHMSNLRQGTPFYMAPEVALQARAHVVCMCGLRVCTSMRAWTRAQ
jgi:serine/threonine protein kinase